MITKLQNLASLLLVAVLQVAALAEYSDCPPGHTGHLGHAGCHGFCCSNLKAPYLCFPQCRASMYNWHANYVHSAYGQPVALVVPPTAYMQTDWSWGAPSTRLHRVDHQFGRDYPGPGPFGGGPYRRTPAWPNDTAQFGVYSVRGPWYPIQR